MDKIFNAGKDFLEDRLQDNKRDDHRQGSGNQSHGDNYSSGGGFFDRDDDDDFREAKEEADKRAGSSGSADLFSSIISSIGKQKSRLADEDLDEQDAVKKHKKAYVDGDDEEADEDVLGAAAALQALKLFNSGETGEKQSKGAFLGLAMSEASKLFDDKASKGKLSSDASKEGVIQKAGEVAMKMYLKSQGEQKGGLLGLASKFM